jgi:hypothetical protein
MRVTRRGVLSTSLTAVGCGCLAPEDKTGETPTIGSAIVANYDTRSHEVSVRLLTEDERVVREQVVTVTAGERTDATRAVIGYDIDAPSSGTFECSLHGRSGSHTYNLSSQAECVGLIVKIGRFDAPDQGLAIYSGRCTDRSPQTASD